jgi:hypothetical protein
MSFSKMDFSLLLTRLLITWKQDFIIDLEFVQKMTWALVSLVTLSWSVSDQSLLRLQLQLGPWMSLKTLQRRLKWSGASF